MDPKKETAAARLGRFLRSDRGLLLLLWLLMFTARMLYTLWDRTQYSLIVSDSTGYYQAGLDFARTGRILYYGYPTALVWNGTLYVTCSINKEMIAVMHVSLSDI